MFISDAHIGAGRFNVDKNEYPYDWDWLPKPNDDSTPKVFLEFIDFLQESYPFKISEIVFLGDMFDNWIFPHDQIPPTMSELLDRNPSIIDAINKLSDRYPIIYLPGNHDMDMTFEIAKKYLPKVRFSRGKFIAGRQMAEHGHHYAMFNAPVRFHDCIARKPLGYWISRIEATRKGRTNSCGRSYHKYLDNVLDFFGSETFPQAIFNAILEESGLSQNSIFKYRDQSGSILSTSALEIIERYKSTYKNWSHSFISRQKSIMAEIGYLGPVADEICEHYGCKVCILAHSHKAKIDKDSWFSEDRIYANTGCWCNSNCYCSSNNTFVETNKDRGVYSVRVMKWDSDNRKVKQVGGIERV